MWGTTLAGVAILIWICSLLIISRDAVNWPQTKGQVVSSLLTIDHLPKFIDLNNDLTRWYGAEVQYEYSVGGRTYLSNRVAIQDRGIRSPKSALNAVNKYRRQHTAIVYYNPANPQEAFLEPANIGDVFMPLAFGLLMVFFGLLILYPQSLEPKIHGVDNHLYWGNIYQKQGKFPQALIEFNKIIDINPNLSQGYKSRGYLFYKLGKLDEAISDFNQVCRIDPTDAGSYFSRSQAYLAQKQYSKAWEDMQKAIELGYYVKPELLEAVKKNL